MTTDLSEVLQRHFGYGEFLPGQQEVMRHLLEGRSAAAVFPTGGGKSLCYQLPALLLPGLTLVVSPLIALMKDQIDALALRGISAARLDSSLTLEEHCEVMQSIRRGDLRLLYVAPERFTNERFRAAIKSVQVSQFAVDEAHCISEWGHNFRPDYLKLVEFAKLCGAERTLALTAAATPSVLEDIRRGFDISPDCAIRTGFYRSNLTLLTTPIDPRERDTLLLDRLKQRPIGPTIVYVTLQKTAEQVAGRLAEAGMAARAYHAGLKDQERTAVQDWFIDADSHIVVATIAFGMGIDKANIRYVYHYNLPKSLENYSQEIGRAGRDGQPATCEVLATREDPNVLENFAYGDTPTRGSIDSLLEDVFSQGAEFDVSLYDLAYQHDIRNLVARTLLTYLELDGYLEMGTPFYANYQFQPRLTSREILDKFEGERREFLARLLGRASKAKTWFKLDVDAAVATLREPRERIVRALEYLHEQSMLELRAAGVRHPYRRRRVPEDPAALAKELFQRMIDRETRDIRRLHQILELIEQDACQVAQLCSYFGEQRDGPCGHCTWCLNDQTPRRLAERAGVAIDEASLPEVEALRRGHPEILGDPRALARFLCGVTSPQVTRAKISHHELFGRCSNVPFGEVMERAS